MGNYILSYFFYISLLSAKLQLLNHGTVEGKPISTQEKQGQKHEGTIKTIWADSDIIDCVDIYKQPVLRHPRIKHIEMEPISYPSELNMEKSQLSILQDWQRFGVCPEGTIPIRRNIQNHYLPPRISPPPLLRRQLNRSLSLTPALGHEYATVAVSGNRYHGASAKVQIWNPTVSVDPEFSVSQIWVASANGEENGLDTMEAGLIVNPVRYGDNRTRFFIFWTANNYQGIGCTDLDCPGFVQTSNAFALGGPFGHISSYGNMGYETTITIYKNSESGHWWLQLQDFVLGYWPESIFTNFPKQDASLLSWGGEIYNLKLGGKHTTTTMGSGHFASEGFQKAGCIRVVKVIDTSNNFADPDPGEIELSVTNNTCYDLNFQSDSGGSYFYYGRPGGNSPQCQ